MNSQANTDFISPSRVDKDDYSEDELALIDKVEQENQDRKKALYEKMMKEETDKDERKLNA